MSRGMHVQLVNRQFVIKNFTPTLAIFSGKFYGRLITDILYLV